MNEWRVMLDTNIVSHIMRFPNSAAGDRLASYPPNQLAISSVVLAELRFGAVRVGSRRLQEQIVFALKTVATLPFDTAAAEHYADLRAHLERAGTMIGSNDLFIAAHARSLDATLITDNIREFSRVPNLRVENWLD